MKRIVMSILIASIATVACFAQGSKETGSQKPRTLVVSTWGLSEDVLHDDVYGPFEEANNCKVILDVGGTSSRYTKYAANLKNNNIDVIELSQTKAYEGIQKGIFATLDESMIPNTELLIPAAKELMKQGFGPAYTLNSIGIIYDREAAGMEIKDFSDLWNPALKGKISIPDIATTNGPAMVYMASNYMGVDITTDNGAAGFAGLEQLKDNIVKTYAKSSDLANMFASGEISVAIVADYGIPTIKQADPNVEFIYPESGTYSNFNTIYVNPNSKNMDLAETYINWRISKELQEKTALTLNEAPTNKEVILTGEDAVNKTYGDVALKAKSVNTEFVNANKENWIDSWNHILNN